MPVACKKNGWRTGSIKTRIRIFWATTFCFEECELSARCHHSLCGYEWQQRSVTSHSPSRKLISLVQAAPSSLWAGGILWKTSRRRCVPHTNLRPVLKNLAFDNESLAVPTAVPRRLRWSRLDDSCQWVIWSWLVIRVDIRFIMDRYQRLTTQESPWRNSTHCLPGHIGTPHRRWWKDDPSKFS